MLSLGLQLSPSLKRFRDPYAQVFILLSQLRNMGPSPVNIKLTLEFPVSQNESYLLYVFANASEELISCQTDYSNIDPRGVRVPPTDHHFYIKLVSKYNLNTLYTIKKNTPISVNTGFYPNNSLLWWYRSTVLPFISIHTILILIMILNDYYNQNRNYRDLHITPSPRYCGITMVPCTKKIMIYFCKYNTVYSMAITATFPIYLGPQLVKLEPSSTHVHHFNKRDLSQKAEYEQQWQNTVHVVRFGIIKISVLLLKVYHAHHLFDQKQSKNSNFVKYYYNLK